MKAFILSPVPLKKSNDSLSEKFKLVGGNPGNMIFIEAVKEQIVYEDIIDTDFNDFEKLKDSILVMPSSNFIRHVKNDDFFTKYYDFIKKTNCKVTLIGLGAQSSRVFNTPKKLVKYGINDEQKRFFRLVSDRAETIGVRGRFTAECLDLMGIHNHKIIGCPSLFKYSNGVFPNIKVPENVKGINTQMTVTPGAHKKNKVLEVGISECSYWIRQSKAETPKLLRFFNKNIVSPKWLFQNFPLLKTNKQSLVNYYEQKSHIFWSEKEWSLFYEQGIIQFAYGTRFHGNMQALRNGVPALWIVHDSRTKELTDFLHLPNISIDEFQNICKVEELLKYCKYDDLSKNYINLCHNYVNYLNENYITHRFDLNLE